MIRPRHRIGALMVLTVLIYSAIGAYAFASTPLEAIQLLVKANLDRTTSVRIAGSIAPDTVLPAETAFYIPIDFFIEDMWEYVVSDDGETLEQVALEHVEDIDDTGVRISFTLTDGYGFGADMIVESEMYDPTQMGQGTILAALEWMAPDPLSEMLIGFVAPQGYIGTGNEVYLFGEDDEGNSVYGMAFADVEEGEVMRAQVAFVPLTEGSEETTPTSELESFGTSVIEWFTPIRMVLSAASILLLLAILLMTYLVRRRYRY